MNRQTAVELLPWLLNDSLKDEERRELEAQLEADPELRNELAETLLAGGIYKNRPSAESLIAYVEGRETSGIPRAILETLIESDTELQEEVAMLRESRKALLETDATVVVASEQAEDNVVAGPWGTAERWRSMAVAASLVAATVTGGWLWSYQGSQGREQGWREQIAALEAENSRLEESASAEAAFPAIGTRTVELRGVVRATDRSPIRHAESAVILTPDELPLGLERHTNLRYAFVDSSGAEVWGETVAAPQDLDHYTIPFAPAELPLGVLDLVVLGIGDGTGEPEELARYPLEVLP